MFAHRRPQAANLAMIAATVLATLAGLFALPSPANALSNGVVISQVYGGGGNSGAPLTHDFVELFNRGSTPVSLNGWSIQYASATGTGNFGASSTQLTELPNVTLQPGQYFLIQESGTGTSNLPTADVVDATPIAMAAGAGKVALVSSAAGLGCNGGSNPCDSTQLAQIVDLVGYGNANFFEGSAAAPTISNTTAALRAGNGCNETDNNGADFAAGAPAPRNTASPLAPCGAPPGDSAPSVTSTTPTGNATGVAANANITITFSEAVNVSGSWFSIVCATSGTHTATVSGGPSSFTLDPDADFAAGESCTVTVFASLVSDQDADDPPDTMAADHSFSFTSAAPLTILPIGQIQGSVGDTADGDTFRSPLAPASGNGSSSELYTIQGVIYQRTLARTSAGALNYGFFIQNTAATADADPNSSDGIFVFMSTFTSLIGGYVPQVGDEVVIRGRVSEFFNFTQLSSASLVSLVRTGVDLDAEVPAFEVNPPDDFADSRRYWERREGMRARIPAGSVTVDGRDVFPGTADAEIWLMRGDHPVAQRANPYARRVFRDFHPLDNQGPLGSFDDGNGYRFMIASYGVKAAADDSLALLPPARTFETLNNAPVGGVYYTFNKFAVMVEQQPDFTPGVDPALNSPPQPFNRFREYSIAPYNVENLYDYRDDPFDGCDFAGNLGCPNVSPPFDYVPASDAAYQARLGEFATQIIEDLHSPDILMIAEAEDQDICVVDGGALSCGAVDNADGKPDTLQELALRIASQGGPAYDAAFDRNGADDRGIVAAFMYRTDRVELVPADAGLPVLGSSSGVSYPGTPFPSNSDVQNPKALNADLPPGFSCGSAPLNCDGSDVYTRAPQVGLFRVYSGAVGGGEPITLWAISNHFSSTPDARVAQRREQAAYNAAIVAAIQAANPGALIAVGGDLNVYPRPDDPFAPGHPLYPTDQLGPLYEQGLVNLFDAALADDPDAAYGYVFQGQTQTIDHIFVSPSLLAALVQVREAHVNADFPADYDGDGPRGLSDHDPQVARFLLDGAPPATTATVLGTANPICPSDCFNGSATVTLSAIDTQSGVATTQYRVNGGPWLAYTGPFVIVAEGANTVEFFSTDAAGNVESTQAITVKITNFPSTGVLDAFNRANGRVGNSWLGATQGDQYVIAGQQVDVGKGGPLLWRTPAFGASQEAFMRLTQIDPSSPHHTLVLKSRGTNSSQGAILVSYDAAGQRVVVEALRPGYGWYTVATYGGIALANGATIGAQALADGSVKVYVNCELIGTADTTAVVGQLYVGQGGRIGVWFHNAPGAAFDDFGGGNVLP